jgi:hypothetical protein
MAGPPIGHPVIYPNPPTGSGPVTVQFSMQASAAEVDLKVFTTAFREINQTAFHNVSAGWINLPLALTDKKGSPLANGVYYILVTTRQGHAVGKLLILR